MLLEASRSCFSVTLGFKRFFLSYSFQGPKPLKSTKTFESKMSHKEKENAKKCDVIFEWPVLHLERFGLNFQKQK